MIENTVMKKLQAGEPTYGIWLKLGSPVTAEVIAHMGYEWTLIDAQHGFWSHAPLVNAIQLISVTPTLPFVRVPGNEFSTIGHILDTGAMGILVPLVNSAQEAQQAVSATYYPPLGSRSIDGLRLWNLEQYDNYVEEANSQILLAVQIESAQGAENAEQIAAVEGVDCLFVGPGDLELSLGYEKGTDEHEQVVQHVVRVAKEQGVALGYACSGLEQALSRAAEGFHFLPCTSDKDILFAGAREFLAELPS